MTTPFPAPSSKPHSSLDYLADAYGIRVDPAVWRRTEETLALITGLESLGPLKILCTNGNLAYFAGQRRDGAIFIIDGHIQKFEGEVRPYGSKPKDSFKFKRKNPTPKPKPSPRSAAVNALRALIESL